MSETNSVSIKLPPFWTSQPQVWFQQAEAQFTIRCITANETKYSYIVTALDQDTASQLLDLLLRPPTENKYMAIKTHLLKTFGLTHRVRANKLLNIDDLGNRMPSALIDEMLSLLDGHQPCMLFEQLFLNRMPDPTHLQLADADFIDPRRVAEQADELWLSMDQKSSSVFHTATYSRQQAKAKETSANTSTEWCFYHNRFEDNARKCVKPCKYLGKWADQPSVAMAASHYKNSLLYA